MLAVLVRPHRNRVSLETAKICRRPWRRQSVHLSMSARSSMSTSAPTPRRPATPQERSSPSTVSPFLTESKKTPRSASRQSQTPRSSSRQSHTLAGNVEPHAAAPSPPVFDGQGSTARTLSFGHVARRPDLGEDRTAERRELARAHAVKLAQKYRQGSASYRSGSDRFGCSADYSMQHFKANENVKLSPGHKPPPIGTYVRTARPARKWHTRSLLSMVLVCVCQVDGSSRNVRSLACAQADIYRDERGTYWDTARKADSVGYQPDSLWYRDSHRSPRSSVHGMVHGRP